RGRRHSGQQDSSSGGTEAPQKGQVLVIGGSSLGVAGGFRSRSSIRLPPPRQAPQNVRQDERPHSSFFPAGMTRGLSSFLPINFSSNSISFGKGAFLNSASFWIS